MNNDDIIDILKDRYFIIAINDAVAFSKLVVSEIPNYFEEYEVSGFSIEELKELANKFLEYNVIAIFMKFELMNAMVQGTVNLKQLYCFKPLIGTEQKGILLPEPYDLEAGKPKRDTKIDENDINIIGNKLEDFNSGKISFEDFLGSL
ncbi:MAG: hypothetical protein M0Q13_12530 [Methanothrix sp.]|jgi:hypothetical protein|nr:hypothetical protein [Methanothrix sp.]